MQLRRRALERWSPWGRFASTKTKLKPSQMQRWVRMLKGNNWLSKQWLVSSDLEIHWFGDPLALMCYSVIAGICNIGTMGRTSSRTRKSTERTTTKQQQQRRRCFGKWQLPSKLSLCMSLSSWPMTLIIRKQGSEVWRSTSLGIHSSSSQCSFEGARSSIEANGVVLQAPKPNWKLPKCKGGSGCWQATASFQSNGWFHLTWRSTGLETHRLWCVIASLLEFAK